MIELLQKASEIYKEATGEDLFKQPKKSKNSTSASNERQHL